MNGVLTMPAHKYQAIYLHIDAALYALRHLTWLLADTASYIHTTLSINSNLNDRNRVRGSVKEQGD
jgi:hypothetical protein